MKYSYTWLKDLSKTKKSPKQLADLLTMRSFELEDLKAEGKETQMEFSILPNRAHDALSHVGIAREICALEERKYSTPKLSLGVAQQKLKTNYVYVDDRQYIRKLNASVKDKKLCPRYIGAVLENIKVTSSPKWMQERLLACGIKPINNIVDITNYVMLETGQPLHAFDIAKLATRNARFAEATARRAKHDIIVRKAKNGEKIKLLDEKEYKLSENDLVIADSEKVLALAGVMGGFDSSITDKTTSIVLESANFNSTSVRKTRVAHNIITESSHRFERDIDPNLAEIGMTRAIELIKEIGGKNVAVTAITDVYPKKMKPWQIKLDTNYVNNLLGENIPVAKMKKILENIGIRVLRHSVSKWMVAEVPTCRIDLKTQEDLIEEIGRIYGYENIREQPLCAEVKTSQRNAKRDFENNLRDILVGLGFSEVMNYSFYGVDDIAKCDLKIEDHVEVANPLSSEQQHLRKNLIPGLLKNAELNLKNFPKAKIFEIGKKFLSDNGKFDEESILSGVLADNTANNPLFFELKGSLQTLLQKIGVRDEEYRMLNGEHNFWHPTRSAQIILNGKKIGGIGEIKPQILKAYSIKRRVAVFGLKIEELMKISAQDKQYKPISKFPTVERDLSMFIEKDTKYSNISANILKNGGDIVKNIDLFDIFEKEGKKSLTLRLKIGSDAKTLTSEEIDAVMKKIIASLEKDLKVKVRK